MNTKAKVTFLKHGSAPPRFIMQAGSKPAKREGDFVDVLIDIFDARRFADRPTLARNGFELVLSQTGLPPDVESESVPESGYAEVRAAMLKATGGREVIIFDHTIRSSDPDPHVRGTAKHAHVDYTEQSIEYLLTSRNLQIGDAGFVQLNAWRPLHQPVCVSPLALLDASSFNKSDLVKSEIVYEDRTGEIYETMHNSGQKWCYFPKMNRDELLLFKGFDSRANEDADVCPHTAFSHPDERKADPPRRSVEFRAIVLF